MTLERATPRDEKRPAGAPDERPHRPAIAGFLAGSLGLLALLAGPSVVGPRGFLEAVQDGATVYVPLDLFTAALATFGAYAKGLLFAGVAAAVPAAGAGIGWLADRAGLLGDPAGPRDAVTLALLAGVVGEAIVLPIFGQGPFGSSFEGSAVALHGPFAVACLLYGLAFVGLTGSTAPARPPAPSPSPGAPVPSPAASVESSSGPAAASPGPSAGAAPLARRAFLGRLARLAGIGSLGASVAVVAGRVVAAGLAVPTGSRRAHAPGGFGPTPAVTPVEEFYVVAKDLVPPTIDPATWRLEVSGLVERPRAFTLDELRAFPRVEAYRTLQCISIQVVRADDLIGNQRWAGVRLRDLLAAVGVRPGASHVLWRSADGYRESLPLEVALDDRTWLVDEMGPPGTPLTVEHGYPLRVLIAGRYGMKQPKWLTGIELADHDEPGYWEQRGWDAQAVVRTYSRIDEPLDGDRVPAGVPFRVYGVANAGDRGIERVEVSADDGRSWTDAELDRRTPGLGPLTWVRWRAEVVVQTPGAAVLVVRATDGRGEVQDGTVRPPLPSGATGWHRVAVVAVSA